MPHYGKQSKLIYRHHFADIVKCNCRTLVCKEILKHLYNEWDVNQMRYSNFCVCVCMLDIINNKYASVELSLFGIHSSLFIHFFKLWNFLIVRKYL